MEQTRSLAVIGTAHNHVRYALDELPYHRGIDLVAIADPDPEAVARFAGDHAVPAYRDHRELLDRHRPDVVMVAGIYSDRATAVVDALRAGAHVLADKPLCTTVAELDEIEQAQRESGRFVSLLLEKRHYPETLAARQLLDSGELGDLVQVASTGPHKLNRASRPAWFLNPATYGGVLGDLAIHDVDLVLMLSGATEGTVSGIADDRYGSMLLRAGRVAATIEVNWLTPAAAPYHGDYHMRLTGTEGTAELFWAQGKLVVTTATRPPRQVETPAGRRPAEEAFEALLAGREPECGTAAGFLATRVALLAQESRGTLVSWEGSR